MGVCGAGVGGERVKGGGVWVLLASRGGGALLVIRTLRWAVLLGVGEETKVKPTVGLEWRLYESGREIRACP